MKAGDDRAGAVSLTGGSGLGGGSKRRPRAERLAAGLLAGGSVVFALICSRHGAAIGGDGVGYVMAARNLLSGYGLSWVGAAGDVRPMTIFGPLFPLLLSALGLFGVDPLAGARALNSVLFGVNTLLVIAILRENSRAAWLSLLGGLLFMFYPPLLGLHAGVQSEPIFLTLLLLEVLFLARAFRSGFGRWLVLAAGSAGLAYLARYAGLAFIASGLATIIGHQSREGWQHRMRQALLFGLVAALPVAGWMLRNTMVAGGPMERSVSFQPFSAAMAVQAVDLVSFWFLPDLVPLLVRALSTIVGAGLVKAAWVRARRRGETPAHEQDSGSVGTLFPVLVWGMAAYWGLILGARALFEPRISFDQRILLPVWLLSILLLLIFADEIHWRAGRAVASLVTAAVILLTASYLVRGSLRAVELQVDGVGFASRAWRTSPLINAMSLLPLDTPIYTNEVEAVVLLTGRRVYRLPTGCLPVDALVVVEPGIECRTPEYERWAANMRRALEHDRAVVAVFNTYVEFPYYAPLVPELVAGLDVLTSQGDGRLYVYDRGEWPESPHW